MQVERIEDRVSANVHTEFTHPLVASICLSPFLYLIILLVLGSNAKAQVRPLHTRDATRLSEVQLADQLGKSDVIFIPVGAVEANGVLPSDRDYASALGFAMAMAEETGGLYMPGLAHSFPGTTVVGSSTVYMSPSQGLAFTKTLARSLLRQGFRRQVWVSVSHGPAALTLGTLARQFFEEERVPILYVDVDRHMERLEIPAAERSRIVFGAHQIAGRLEDLPVRGDYGPGVGEPPSDLPENEGLKRLGALGFSGSLTLGSWIADTMSHGGSRGLPTDAAEREEWGRVGGEQVQAIVKKLRLPDAMEALRLHDQYTREVIIPRFKNRLPPPRDSL